jgi:osmotically-inducible protein OsmY
MGFFMRRFLVLATVPLLLNACASMVVTGATQTGLAVAENRSIGRKVDDTVIYTDLTNQFAQADQVPLLGQVTFNVRYARVMLTGNMKSEEDAAQAVALSWKAKGVTEIINELIINPDSTLLDTAGDSLIKRNLEARLLITKGVWVINYSIDVVNGTAYLIGRVKDQAELDRALNIARTTKGIKRVVSHLQISTDVVHPTADPQDANATNSNRNGDSNSSPAYSPARPTSNANDQSSDVYTGPVYGSGSISSAPIDAPK